MKSVRIRQSVGGEQGWLNEVYLWEKFDIGLQYNVRQVIIFHQPSKRVIVKC